MLAVARVADLESYALKFAKLASGPNDEFDSKVGGARDCGAFPSGELRAAKDFTFRFTENWTNHEDARLWAFQILEGRTTFANRRLSALLGLGPDELAVSTVFDFIRPENHAGVRRVLGDLHEGLNAQSGPIDA